MKLSFTYDKLYSVIEKRNPADSGWLGVLDEEDLAFLKRFLLASGSLKKTAAAYGISYPTVRLRLDRLIAKIQVAEEHGSASPLERTIRAAHADGKIDLTTMKSLLRAYRSEREESS